ncbi:MAG: hypothetical protein ACOYT8_01155 [Candidatus Dependentiae bacterium]
MVYRKKLALAFILGGIVLPATSTRTEENPYVIGGLIVGGAAMAGLGIGALLGWFDEKNQSIIDDAHKTLSYTEKEYSQCINYLLSEGILKADTHYLKNYLPATEEQLYHIADYHTITHPHNNFANFIYSLNNQIEHLVDLDKKIAKRIKSIQSKNYIDHQAQRELSAFKELAEQLYQELPLYQQLYTFFKSHQFYFSLFELEAEIRKHYVNEINIVTHHHTDLATCLALLKVQAMSGGSQKYPLKNYVDALGRNISRLSNQLAMVGDYPQRIRWCIDLKNQLTFVKGIIAADPSYTAEVIAYEKEKIEREKLELAEKELALQAAQLAAMKEKNKIEREKNRLEAEKVKLEKKKQYESTATADLYVTVKL